MTANAKAPAPGPDVLLELGRCRDADDLSLCLTRRPDFVCAAVVEVLTEAVRQRVRVDVDEALRLAEAALAIAGILGDSGSLGRGNRAKANALWYKGNLKAAVELFESAVTHFERGAMAEDVGRTLSSSIQPLALLGEYERALQVAERARRIFDSIADPWRMARLEINIANIYHRQDRFPEALASYERAYQQLLPHKDAEAMAVALHNISVCLIVLNDFDRALETYRRAREVCENHDMPLLAAQADYNIAYLYFLRGDYDTAINGLRATRKLCERNGDAYHAALCDLDESEIYIELNLTEEAANMARRAQEQFEKLCMAFETGRSVFHLAIATHQRQDSTQALELFAKAADIFAGEKNAAWQSLIGLYRALVLFDSGQSEDAMRLCQDALAFFESAGLERRAILCRLLLARISETAGQTQAAYQHCESALSRLATTVEAPLLSYHAHALLGHLQQASGKPRQSYQSYRRAVRDLETLRSSLQGEELKIAFMKNKLDVHESLVGICLRRGGRTGAEEAFRYMEQAKSRSLVELVFGRGNPWSWPAGDGAGDERIRALRQELNWYYRRIEIEQTRPDAISAAQINSLRVQAREREDALLRAIREVPRGSPSESLRKASGPLTLAQIRAALGPDASLLEYFQVESHIVAAVVTHRHLKLVQLGPVAEVAASIRMLEFQISQMEGFKQKAFEQHRLAAAQSRLQELYRLLVAPVADSLKGRHLVVVPHGVLHYLPFHALSDGKRYLIDDFTISYAPSASVYAIRHPQRANTAGPSLLLGVHDEKTPWIRREIRSVAAVVPDPQVRWGEHATASVIREAGPSSRLIHIATHGIFRRDNPMFSSVRLSDSYLTMYDLYQLRLPVELFTLSGCGTGLNVVAAGDEQLGLMRGLLSAGAESLLLTLWNVHDQTTARFMKSFYGRMLQHSDKALALREAMQELRKSHPHPYYWAPFILVGKAFHSGA